MPEKIPLSQRMKDWADEWMPREQEKTKHQQFLEEVGAVPDLGVMPYMNYRPVKGKSLVRPDYKDPKAIEDRRGYNWRNEFRRNALKPAPLPTPNMNQIDIESQKRFQTPPAPKVRFTPNVNRFDMERKEISDKYYKNAPGSTPPTIPTPNVPDHEYELESGEIKSQLSELFLKNAKKKLPPKK